MSGLAWRDGYGHPVEALPQSEPREVFSACAAAALYRRDRLLEVRGFDEDYFCYFEDVDLGFRLRLAGYRCIYVPSAVACHDGSASTGPQSDFVVYHGHRNLVWTYWKNMPGVLLCLYWPQHLLGTLAAVFWYAIRGQGRVVLKAKWDALRGLGRVLAQRRQIQHHRRVRPWALREQIARSWLLPYRNRLIRRGSDGS